MEVQVEGVGREEKSELGAEDYACCCEEGESGELACSTRARSRAAASQGEEISSC